MEYELVAARASPARLDGLTAENFPADARSEGEPNSMALEYTRTDFEETRSLADQKNCSFPGKSAR